MPTHSPAEGDYPIIFKGGPSDLPKHPRTCDVHVEGTRAFVTFYGQNHHFELSGEEEYVNGIPVSVFCWTYSTAVAE
ncbi:MULTISPECIES: DUF5988 family protein [unclassified Streptomyces]|uniref:DUF5988 family protein n=1 Tax=unclassified Streptomyces TaxID=2593676 RepID=UPI000A8C6CA0|nr:DUF5988 family protein [Streptomyces sp. TSRI0281]